MKQQCVGLRCFFFMMLSMSSFATYAQKTLMLHVSRAARAFEVTLPANPTTGYQWTVKQFDKARLKLKSQRYIRPQSTLIGAGGQTTFSFQLQPGQSPLKQTDMVFSYAQPWNSSTATLTKVTVIFK